MNHPEEHYLEVKLHLLILTTAMDKGKIIDFCHLIYAKVVSETVLGAVVNDMLVNLMYSTYS